MHATAAQQSNAPQMTKTDPVDEELEQALKASLRMENARQETVAMQAGARVEGNAIVPPDVGERVPLESLPPPAGADGALWDAKLRWLERTYGSMRSVRGAEACGKCRLRGATARYPGLLGLTLGLMDVLCNPEPQNRAGPNGRLRCGREARPKSPIRHAGDGNCFYRALWIGLIERLRALDDGAAREAAWQLQLPEACAYFAPHLPEAQRVTFAELGARFSQRTREAGQEKVVTSGHMRPSCVEPLRTKRARVGRARAAQ